jgi:hypothetical protein
MARMWMALKGCLAHIDKIHGKLKFPENMEMPKNWPDPCFYCV